MKFKDFFFASRALLGRFEYFSPFGGWARREGQSERWSRGGVRAFIYFYIGCKITDREIGGRDAPSVRRVKGSLRSLGRLPVVVFVLPIK